MTEDPKRRPIILVEHVPDEKACYYTIDFGASDAVTAEERAGYFGALAADLLQHMAQGLVERHGEEMAELFQAACERRLREGTTSVTIRH